MKTIIEPFRIKSVEPVYMTTREERESFIRDAHYNLFGLKSVQVLIDLLTDSGTSAMSSNQWAAIQRGDESYAGSESFFRFYQAVTEIMPFKHVIPTHQGRAAEKILFSVIGGEGKQIPNNTHFDTTRANIEFTGARAVDLVIEEGKNPQLIHPFKGNMDIDALRSFIDETGPENIPCVMLTLTNNSGGGQPVSMQNIRDIRKVCDEFKFPLIFDACRFAENAYFIKIREDGFGDKSVKEICLEIFSYADGCTMSAKKDALVNIGGFLCLNDDDWAAKARNLLILTEGFPTYGGLAGRDLDAIAVGLHEILEEDYLHYRIRSTEYLGEKINAAGVPIVLPVGGHAVYIDAKAMLPHIPTTHFPGQTLAVELYLAGGIRGCEIGSVMFGKSAQMELVRLAIPRRVYTQSHIDYVIEVIIGVYERRNELRGMNIIYQPEVLRHFTCHFKYVDTN
ncbi:MAG: tryptophanase [Calditrichia bacterium]|nr:tryptophanase [Calditrichia bacterium]